VQAHAKNVWRNAVLRSMMQTMVTPFMELHGAGAPARPDDATPMLKPTAGPAATW
jgi:hypothetical protein